MADPTDPTPDYPPETASPTKSELRLSRPILVGLVLIGLVVAALALTRGAFLRQWISTS